MTIDGKETVGVKVSQKGHPDIDLYFDKKNGLPVKCSARIVENKNGDEATHSLVFNNYRKSTASNTSRAFASAVTTNR